MQVRDIMCENPAVCTPAMSLQEAAKKMVECDCGAIPVVENQDSKKVIGVITDRDITCRCVAEGKNPLDGTVGDVMTRQAHTVTPETSVDECCNVMEEHQVRRVPVVDGQGACCGIVAQADIARKAPREETAEVVCEVSKPTAAAAI